MNFSSVIAEELKGLNNRQLKSIYSYIKSIKSLKKEKVKPGEEISLPEIWQITAKSPGNWSRELEEMREERI